VYVGACAWAWALACVVDVSFGIFACTRVRDCVGMCTCRACAHAMRAGVNNKECENVTGQGTECAIERANQKVCVCERVDTSI